MAEKRNPGAHSHCVTGAEMPDYAVAVGLSRVSPKTGHRNSAEHRCVRFIEMYSPAAVTPLGYTDAQILGATI